ncbi:D-alanyl-D-alanine carboxypeptidase/D-alanyl-D-alanine endopeptidase [Actinokineospora auranticolor]|uniref:D-alanyl-D-alanine carboxypeptidase/D-alanyl-D-alanine endopeptidase n=1 Tax=Actinokineospora auranticolor TaxID=155976 RepID=UPI0015E3C03C|nr:D-alanyl-D-alanine carboxypeptidase/D-alanyl-D-alanine-endopeptidase [Actinokineospora auranticolor]
MGANQQIRPPGQAPDRAEATQVFAPAQLPRGGGPNQNRPGLGGRPEEAAERTQFISVGAVSREPAPLEVEDEPAPAVKRKRTGLVVSLVSVVALLALAAGAVFLVPGLAEKVGLRPSEPDVPIAAPSPPVQFTPTLRRPGADSPAPTAAGVQAALAGPASNSVLGALTGTVIDPTTGDVLYAQNADTTLVPASTTKVLTSAAALLALPHSDQLTTKVVQGDQPGTVIIVGGGDPTLSSFAAGKDTVYPGAAHLDDLVAQVKTAGPVDTVLLDVGRYTGDSLAKGWIPGDVQGGYIAPMVPAMLDGGRADPTAAVSPRAANPARALAEKFAERIGAKVPAKATTTAKPDAKVLGEVRSAPIVELVDNALQNSDNVLAEAVAREVAKETGHEVSFTGATEATTKILRDNGFDVSTVRLSDGSGLSTDNLVSAALLADILRVAAAPDGKDPRTAKLRPLLGGLPVAGGSGTLAGRYQGPADAVGKGWVRAKTGTLANVNSLAGVVLTKDGRLLVFAMMSNGSNAAEARPALDAVAATLRQCGCR